VCPCVGWGIWVWGEVRCELGVCLCGGRVCVPVCGVVGVPGCASVGCQVVQMSEPWALTVLCVRREVGGVAGVVSWPAAGRASGTMPKGGAGMAAITGCVPTCGFGVIHTHFTSYVQHTAQQ
jgi:hypothetical protein